MLYSVKGELIHLEPRTAVICCGGVGFRCQITMNTARQLPSIGKEAMLYTMMNVREDAIELFGFADQKELACFKQLTAISGVGPKLAQRIALELKDKVGGISASAGDFDLPAGAVVSAAGNAAQAVEALSVLGFTAGEASAAVGKLDSALPVETLVRESLKMLARRG